MSLVATWYGLILGVGEMVYYDGIMAWIVNGVFWYGIYYVYARYFAEKIHKRGFIGLLHFGLYLIY